jgi:hypothetical protein
MLTRSRSSRAHHVDMEAAFTQEVDGGFSVEPRRDRAFDYWNELTSLPLCKMQVFWGDGIAGRHSALEIV